jgi:DNA-binding response OmpR family regulator
VLYPLSYGGSGNREVTSRSIPLRRAAWADSLAFVGETLGRVLVVDDSDVIRHLISVNLEMEGFEVITAVDGQDALDKMVDVLPDVMTIDVKMPRLDGFTTVAMLRADPRMRQVKVAMVTACAQDSDVERGAEVGVDAFITKPFDPSNLVRTVRDLVARNGVDPPR